MIESFAFLFFKFSLIRLFIFFLWVFFDSVVRETITQLPDSAELEESDAITITRLAGALFCSSSPLHVDVLPARAEMVDDAMLDLMLKPLVFLQPVCLTHSASVSSTESPPSSSCLSHNNLVHWLFAHLDSLHQLQQLCQVIDPESDISWLPPAHSTSLSSSSSSVSTSISEQCGLPKSDLPASLFQPSSVRSSQF